MERKLRFNKPSAFALVVVLAVLVLLSAIVMAFLTSATTEVGASRSYSGQTNTRLLADSAVNLVISQIRQASTTPGNAWISQPGLIRTFDTSGAPVNAYKLYSSDQLVVPGSFDPAAGADLPANAPLTTLATNQPGLYSDMNSPVFDPRYTNSSGTPVPIYPILDGNSISADGSGNGIVDLNNGSAPDVQGFKILNYANNGVAMPVKWLYVLQDGTMVPASASTGKDVTVGSGAVKPGATNPIVARIAFWTDDETSKVNINTASEGTFWDTPVCNTQNAAGMNQDYDDSNIYEWDLAQRVGDNREYQRYPGHPATTCLSPVLGTSIKKALGIPLTGAMTTAQRTSFIEAFNKIAPRITGTDSAGNDYSSDGATKRAGPNPIANDTDRLYASADELFFAPARTPQNLTSGDARRLVEGTKFFLTANSRAPEQNLFNKPRVAIWPITRATIGNQADTSKMTAFDKLIAFCATVGGNAAYYFERANPQSPTVDWSTRNAQIYAYLQSLTGNAIPGFGGNFVTKYTAPERNQILTEIFDYIRCTNLSDMSEGGNKTYTLPDTGTSAANAGWSYFSNRGQVVPINPTPGILPRGFGRIATISELALIVMKDDTRWDNTQFGNATVSGNFTKDFVSGNFTYVTVSSTLNEMGTRLFDPVTLKKIPTNLLIDPATQTRIGVALVPNLFCPMAGFSAMANNIRLKFTNLNITVNGTPCDFNNPMKTPPSPNDIYDIGRFSFVNLQNQDNESKMGGNIGQISLYQHSGNYGAPPDSMPPSAYVVVPGTSWPIPPPASGTTTMTIGGSTDIEVYAPYNASTPIQTFHFVFPSQVVSIPLLNYYGTNQPLRFSRMFMQIDGTQDDRVKWNMMQPIKANTNRPKDFSTDIITTDVVRSLVPTGLGVQSDLRLIAAMPDINSGVFLPLPNYVTPNNTLSHCLTWGRFYSDTDSTNELPGCKLGSLIQGGALTLPNGIGNSFCAGDNMGVRMTTGFRPYLPGAINGVTNSLGQPGDWDNGPHSIGDGPLLNKADEGTDLFSGDTPYLGNPWNYQATSIEPATLFSPNRQISSPVMFGSLPTGVARSLPWQTLLFRPTQGPGGGPINLPGGLTHPGAASPRDHLLLDLFWMPVVEPYAISEPFSTAGKINLNYQIAPFTHIKRDTGLRAVLQSIKITALNPKQKSTNAKVGQFTIIPETDDFSVSYKRMGSIGSPQSYSRYYYGGGAGVSVRRNIDIDNTLRQFEEARFKSGVNKPFISASEICDMPLIPADIPTTGTDGIVNAGITSADSMSSIDSKLATFWNANGLVDHSAATVKGHFLTGDNNLERPYSLIYPRVTTKSNTYTVHVRVQSLKKIASDPDQGIFKDGRDQVLGEFRGSFVVERYLDPNTAGFYKDGQKVTGTDAETDPLTTLGPYKFRVVSTKQFGQ